MLVEGMDKFDALMQSMLRAGRIPGAAIGVVAHGKPLIARGYGYRDLESKLPMTSETLYPIASTTKAINATLLGMLVDEGKLAWDEPVQNYLPNFRLQDPLASTQVTMRDLVVMRTGLPRHDWTWGENPISRAQLVKCLPYLDLSAGFRERFQYNNVTVIVSAYIAEVITGRSWEGLVSQRILEPLGMLNTQFALPRTGNVTLAYHENSGRELKLSRRPPMEVSAPSGGSIQSTVEDMMLWMLFNLNEGRVAGGQLVSAQTLAMIHTPQVVVGSDLSGPTPNATYAMGWFVDTYNGCERLSHGGYFHDVNSGVMLFPKEAIGIVSFINFGPPGLARLINEHAFDLLMGFHPVQTVEHRLAQYEASIENTRQRNSSVRRVKDTLPSHSLSDYAGIYLHPGYGEIEIQRSDQELVFRRNDVVLPLQHWHYDSWVAKDTEMFLIHVPHAFDPTNRLSFETNSDGEIAAILIRLESAVAPVRFTKKVSTSV